MAEEIPYVALRGRIPTLPAIYVEQRTAIRLAAGAHERENIEEALQQHSHVFIEGEPGIGKSSLLRYMAMKLARDSVSGRPASLVPVLVSARQLLEQGTGLSSSLRPASAALLGFRLRASLPEDFFEYPPAAGASWLVLIDGLDEIVDSRVRRAFASQLCAAANEGWNPIYRVVMASRAGAADTLESDTGFARYLMLPFERAQTSAFAEKWFRARASNPAAEAASFMRYISGARFAGLERNPLLLTLSALVFEDERDRALPTRRAGVYERVVQMLLEEEGHRDLGHEFCAEWRKRFGLDGDRRADSLWSSRRLVIELLALRVQSGRGEPLEDELLEQLVEESTIPMSWASSAADRDWLRGQLSGFLLRSGLAIRDGTHTRFFHDSFREYLAASAQIRTHADPEGPRSWEVMRSWGAAPWGEVALFALGIWSEAGSSVGHLIERVPLWHGGGLRFAARAVGDGAQVGPEQEARIVDAVLEEVAKHGDAGSSPTLEAVMELGARAHVRDGLLALAATDGLGVTTKERIARTLADLGYLDEVLALAGDERTPPQVRVRCTERLVSQGWSGDELLDILDRVLRDALSPDTVLAVAALVAKIGKREQAVALALRLAAYLRSTPGKPSGGGVGAEGWTFSNRRAHDLLRVARQLGRFGQGQDARDLFWSIAVDDEVFDTLRVEAAEEIALLGEVAEAQALLLDMCSPPRAKVDLARLAALALIRLGRRDVVLPVLRDILGDRAMEPLDRLSVAEAAGRGGWKDLETAACREVAGDEQIHPSIRAYAAERLAVLGEMKEALSTLLGVITDSRLGPQFTLSVTRWRVARVIRELEGSDLASGPLLEMANDQEWEAVRRWSACRAAAELGLIDEVEIVLLDLIPDLRVTTANMDGVIGELFEVGMEEEAVNLSMTFEFRAWGHDAAASSQWLGWLAALTLAQFGRPGKAGQTLATLLDSGEKSLRDRLVGARALGRIGFVDEAEQILVPIARSSEASWEGREAITILIELGRALPFGRGVHDQTY